MSTTQVFIELLITGFGGLLWIAIAVCLFTGFSMEEFAVIGSVNFLILPVSGIAYVIGIIIDRIGYQIFISLEHKNAAKVFLTDDGHMDIQQKTVFISQKSERLGNKIDYNRSRLRLCRSWIINFFFIFLTLILFILKNDTNRGMILAIAITALVLSLLSYYVWRKLSKDYYLGIKSSFDSLKGIT